MCSPGLSNVSVPGRQGLSEPIHQTGIVLGSGGEVEAVEAVEAAAAAAASDPSRSPHVNLADQRPAGASALLQTEAHTGRKQLLLLVLSTDEG